MPTGYTAEIQKGISFEQYALNCSRAFGAMVMMRDEDSDAKIPEKFEPSNYHLEAREKAEGDLVNLLSLTSEELDHKALLEFEDKEERRLKALEDNVNLEKSYKDMLAKAKEWVSPSSDHDKLKEFMISQIEDSIKFDCNLDYYKEPTPKLNGKDWREEKLTKLHRDIAYHTKNYSEEVVRTNDRNKWIEVLRNSLKGETL